MRANRRAPGAHVLVLGGLFEECAGITIACSLRRERGAALAEHATAEHEKITRAQAVARELSQAQGRAGEQKLLGRG